MHWKPLLAYIAFLQIQGSYQVTVINFRQERVGINSVDFQWDRYNGAETYTLFYWEYPQRTWAKQKQLPGNAIRYTLEGLTSGTSYQAHIAANIGPTESTENSTAALFTTAGPKPVLAVTVTDIRSRDATVEWTIDQLQKYDSFTILLINSSTNQNIERYNIKGDGGRLTFFNLLGDTGYSCGVFGRRNNLSSTIKINGFRTLPRLGKIVQVRINDILPHSASINWVIDNLEYVSFYTIEYAVLDNNNLTTKNTNNDKNLQTYSIIGLTPSTEYKARVRSAGVLVNGIDVYSEWSEWITFTTIKKIQLAAPTGLNIFDVTIDSCKASWVAPQPSTDIQYYNVQFYQINQRPTPPIKIPNSQTTYSITHLLSGTDYRFQVQGVTIYNTEGLWSTAGTFITLGPKPVAFIGIYDIQQTSAIISWSTYSGSNFDTYQITLIDTNNREETTVRTIPLTKNFTSITLDNLKDNNGYRVEITTMLKDTSSSIKTNGFRTQVAPDIVNNIMACSVQKSPDTGIGNVKLTCNKIPGQTVTKYEVRIAVHERPDIRDYAEIQQFVSSSSTSSTKQVMEIMNLMSGYTYELYARAVFPGAVDGVWTTASLISIEGGRPPRFATISGITAKDASVSWFDPYKDEPITTGYKYRVQYIDLDDSTYNATREVAQAVTRINYKDTFKPNRRYHVYISTILNTDGTKNGTAYTTGFRSALGKPPAPFYPNVEIKSSVVTFLWQRVPLRTDIISYEVKLEEAENPHIFFRYRTYTGLQHSFIIPSVDYENGKSYFVSVRAIVDHHLANTEGFWSAKVNFKTGEDTGFVATPKDIKQIQVSSNYMVLQWRAPEDQNIMRYEVSIKDASGGTEIIERTSGLTNIFRVQNLLPDTTYTYQVRAVAISGEESLWSASVPFTTPKAGTITPSEKTDSGSGISTTTVVGIIVAVFIIVIILAITIIVIRKRQLKFNRFDNSVKFSKSNGYNNGGIHGSTGAELDDPAATAIKKQNKLYL